MSKSSVGTIEEIRDAIRRMHFFVKVTHVESVPVKHTFRGRTAWTGTVEVFDIEGHEFAKRLYAWAEQLDGGKRRFVTVLCLDPIDSARAAVQAAIVRDYRLVQEG